MDTPHIFAVIAQFISKFLDITFLLSFRVAIELKPTQSKKLASNAYWFKNKAK